MGARENILARIRRQQGRSGPTSAEEMEQVRANIRNHAAGPLPEAAVELQAYLTYWQSQGEPDLSGWAGQLLERLTP